MDQFDYIEPGTTTKRILGWFWNLLTFLVFLATLGMVGLFAYIFIYPNSTMNLFPPPTLPQAMSLPTLTPTALQVLPATWTPLPTATPTFTSTPLPTVTSTPTETPNPQFTATATLTGTVALENLPFALNSGSPVAISSLTFHPEAGCNWMGVAGQILNLSGAPLSSGLVVQSGGMIAGANKEFTSLSGTAIQYGEAGYEIVLASKPMASTGTFWIQIFDQAGLPLSPQYYFDTFNTCDKNLIMINFRQVRE